MKILIVYLLSLWTRLHAGAGRQKGPQSVKGAEVLFRRVEEFDIVLTKTADEAKEAFTAFIEKRKPNFGAVSQPKASAA